MGDHPLRSRGPDRLDRPVTDPLFARLFPPLATGVDWGIDRVVATLEEIGNPHWSYPTLHVGGTNGKGSVAAMLASVLSASRLKTGLYTSPHLCSFRERFQVAGRPILERRLLEAADGLREVLVRRRLTFFEAATVLGFHAFARERVDAAVIEVGLGGRLDATNVVTPEVSIVTNVAMDHADYLGDTLEKIAGEKAGIAKPGVPFVTSENDPAILDVFARACAAVDAPLHVLDRARIRDVVVDAQETRFTFESRSWGALKLATPLLGEHQAVNAALVVEAIERMTSDLRPSLRDIVGGIATVSWPGRNQIEEIDGRTWLFDVAHNAAGAESLCALLDRVDLPRPWVALVGVLADKDWGGMLPHVFERAQSAILTQPPSAPAERRWDPDGAATALRPFLPDGYPLATEPEFARALGRAQSAAGQGTVIVTGSSHTVGDALRYLGCCPFGG